MGICCSTDNTPAVPEVIIPDPEFGESCEFTINRCGWSGTSRDHQAYRTHDAPKEMNRWLFLNKSGSKWGGKCKITVENFVREDPEKPKQGQILWEAHFVDTPFFQVSASSHGKPVGRSPTYVPPIFPPPSFLCHEAAPWRLTGVSPRRRPQRFRYDDAPGARDA